MNNPAPAQIQWSVEGTTMNTINNFPDILQMIFDHLSFNQKLITRLVHSKWNKQLTRSLAETTVFRVSNTDSQQTLLDSQISWTNLKLCGISDLELPTTLKNSVSSLHLQLGTLRRKYLDYTLVFPNVEKLSIGSPEEFGNFDDDDGDDDDDGTDDDDDDDFYTSTYDDENIKFRKFANNLKFVSFKFSNGNFKRLKLLLKVLNHGKTLNLIQFELIEDHPGRYGRRENSVEATISESIFSSIVDVISKCASKLKILRLEFHTGSIRNGLATEVLDKLKPLKELELKEAYISVGINIKIPMTKENFLIHQEFLQSQKDSLVGFSLPWRPNCENSHKILQTIGASPKAIKQIELLRSGHLKIKVPKFCEAFTGLKTLSIVASRNYKTFDFSGVCPNVRKLELFLIKDPASQTQTQKKEESHSHFFKNLTQTMTNLTNLIVHESAPSSDEDKHLLRDSDLQMIIKELTLLKVLKIEHGGRITDFGVSGTGGGSSNEVLQSRELYLSSTGMEIKPSDSITGVPISSLKHLEQLELMWSQITDAGIYFGFRFGPSSSLRCLALDSTSKNVTTWGLNCLARFLPKLESFTGYFREDRNSDTVKERLKEQLPLTKLAGKHYVFLRERDSENEDDPNSESD